MHQKIKGKKIKHTLGREIAKLNVGDGIPEHLEHLHR
jgi:hypothetical protein